MVFWARKDWADMSFHEREARRARNAKRVADRQRHKLMAAKCEFHAYEGNFEGAMVLIVEMPVLVDAVHRLPLEKAAERDKRIRTDARTYTMYGFSGRDGPTFRKLYGNPGVITIERISPGECESDSLARITEPARDGIADVFSGQDRKGRWLGHYWDADHRPGACRWHYRQDVKPGVFGLRVYFKPRDRE